MGTTGELLTPRQLTGSLLVLTGAQQEVDVSGLRLDEDVDSTGELC